MGLPLMILAILPGLAISYYIYVSDEHEKEPHEHLILCFIFGMVSTAPAILLEELGMGLGLDDTSYLFGAFIFAFGVVAFSEELVKFLFLRFYIYEKDDFNEPFDGIVYSVMIGMGFATVENILYASRYGIETVFARMFTAVPAHAAFAIIMGYYAGRAKFEPEQSNILLMKGLFLAIAVHGAYDFFIFQENYPALAGFTLVSLILAIVLSKNMMVIHQRNSPFKDDSDDFLVEDEDLLA